MNKLRRATLALTIKYSILFFASIWLLSGGVYLWVNNSLGEGYLKRVNAAIEQDAGTKDNDLTANSASIVADVTLDRLRNILLIVNGLALVGVQLIAYTISRRTLFALVQSERARQAFLANASHELRTPLAVMLGDLDWALKKPRQPNDYVTTLGATRAEVLSMTNTIHGLLSVSRLEDQRLRKLEPVNLHELSRYALDRYADVAKKRSLTFKANLSDQIIPARTELVGVVLNNLIDNAVKYAPSGSVITVALNSDSPTLSITNAIGPADAKKVHHMFDRFYRGSGNDTGGYGLGLSITRQIVEALGGIITAAETTTDSLNTITFTVRFKK